MATLVTFHAHPDDECIATGGLMAKAAAAPGAVRFYDDTGGLARPLFLPAGMTDAPPGA